MSSPEAERGGEQGAEGAAEGVASPPTRPGESPAAAGAHPQEGEAQEGRGMSTDLTFDLTQVKQRKQFDLIMSSISALFFFFLD